MNKYLLTLILITLLAPPSLFAYAQEDGVSCEVSPYSQSVEEGRAVTYAVSFDALGAGEASRAVLGGLPGGVTGHFEDGDTVVISALVGAQLGSFDISILYDVQDGNSLLQSACAFNVVVEAGKDRDKTQDYIPLPSYVQQAVPVIQKGVITGEPLSIDEGQPPTDGVFMSPLYRGMSGEEVALLQSVLKDAGYFPGWVQTTGYYGPITENAVAEFQRNHDIPPFGFVGPLTRDVLNSL